MNNKLDMTLTASLVLCAMIVTALYVRRELFTPETEVISTALPPPPERKFVEAWEKYLRFGKRMGPETAPLQIVEFADFECPSCVSFYQHLEEVRRHMPSDIAVTFVHFPLPFHSSAEPAARAVECAGEQGQWEPMYHELFKQQGNFAGISWHDMAATVGVPDIPEFSACLEGAESKLRVQEGKRLGQELGIPGTPTIIANGWLLAGRITASDLELMVEEVLAGRPPIKYR